MRLNDVWVRYGRTAAWVLEAAAAELRPGDVAVVLGRNRAGKSTLLSAAAGIRPPTRGTVTGRPAVVGYVPERFPSAQPFTARAYLQAMAAVRGAPVSAIGELAERFHLTPFLDTRLAELSKGSAQKVGLAQALLVPPGLLVLDEPWEGLDAPTRAEIPAVIHQVTEAGGMVLVSDHRGETVKLPHAVLWTIQDGQLTVAVAGAEKQAVIEIAVAASKAEATAARLRADGHEILTVRQ